MHRAPSIRRQLMRGLAPAIGAVAAVTLGLSTYFVHELDDELNRSMRSLSKSVSYAAGHANATNNLEVIALLQQELMRNQGVELLAVTKDGRDMITKKQVHPDLLAQFESPDPIYYYSGNTPGEEVGKLYFRKHYNFLQMHLFIVVPSVLLILLVLGIWLRSFLTRSLVTPIDHIGAAIRNYAADGFKTLNLEVNPSYNRELQELSRVAIAMDESLQESQRQLREKVEQENRMLALRSVLHDIKNYVQKIDTPSQLIRRKINKSDVVPDELKNFVAKQCDILDNTASQMRENEMVMRDVMQAGAQREIFLQVRDEPFEILPLIGRLEKVYRPLCEAHGVSLELEMPVPQDGPLKVRGDARLLSNSVDNLLKNALDAFERAASNLQEPVLVIRIIHQYCRVVVVVEDNGPGLPTKVAEDFRLGRATASQEGWGVGLKYVREYMGLMGVPVGYEPKVPSGSRFSFDLEEASLV